MTNNNVKRIDPHLERIKRNRLHPRYNEVNSMQTDAPASYMGPNGIIRKNPHNIGFIGPNGIKRIDWNNLDQSSMSSQQAGPAEQQKPLHQVNDAKSYVVVVPDLPAGRLSSHDKDILGFAQTLAQQAKHTTAVLVIAFGDHKETGWQDAGVDRLLELNSDTFAGYCPEARTAALKALAKELDVLHFLLPDSVDQGADLGRRLAAALDIRPVTHGWKYLQDSLLCRAGAGTLDIKKSLSQVMLLDAEIADPIDETQHEAHPLMLTEDFAQLAVEASIVDQGMLAVDPADISLAEAPFILSGGNGIRDWQTFHDAARILGATEGASRVAVDDGFMPRHRQVGATGTWVTARVYIAVGISGAVQHLQGIAQVDKVIAINTNPGCDMVKRADLSIIADSTDILTALIEAQGGSSFSQIEKTEKEDSHEQGDSHAA